MLQLSLASAAILAALSCVASAQTSAPNFVENGELVVCTTASFPPLTYRADPGDTAPIGIDIDVATELARRFDATPKYQTTDFSGLLPSLSAGRCDLIISGIYINTERRKTFSGISYMQSTTAIITAATNTDITSPEDLSGKVIALESGAYYNEEQIVPLNAELEAAGKPAIQVRDYPTPQEATQQVMIGRVDATMSEGTEAAYRMAQAPGKLRVAYVYPSAFTYGIYIQPDEANTQAVVSALKEMKSEGFFITLAEKYGLNPTIFDVDYDS
ncbi:ABC transporter substrate-binding protein [Roseovarius arcticus]|uniref:ABC transporter substrate-binding protein n=1 Tax=Roseovarius arcticus TaxID=2547404 RepID=UPI00111080C3|nr:ABC transporter substrate-binding protein [Roseovarius arcticus]